MSADGSAFMANARLEARDERFLRLLSEALGRIPRGVLPVRSVRTVRLRRKGRSPTLVGLTTYTPADRSVEAPLRSGEGGTQTITFYADIFHRLSDEAALAVIVHEFAHAWLNEHHSPEESKGREKEADEMAASWGFGRELGALDGEAYSL